MFEQAVLPVQDGVRFGEIKLSLEQPFASANVAGYLRSLKSSKLRARDFEGLLARGLLGNDTAEIYGSCQSPTGARCGSFICRWSSGSRRSCGQNFSRYMPTTEDLPVLAGAASPPFVVAWRPDARALKGKQAGSEIEIKALSAKP